MSCRAAMAVARARAGSCYYCEVCLARAADFPWGARGALCLGEPRSTAVYIRISYVLQ
eukprot:COSAG06_NODE_46876_length_343_cov_1.270492_2_plen_57_part_01